MKDGPGDYTNKINTKTMKDAAIPFCESLLKSSFLIQLCKLSLTSTTLLLLVRQDNIPQNQTFNILKLCYN